MFKFFRVYNKIILVVGGCVLMVAFLIPQAVQMFGPNPLKERLGTMHGQKVVRAQLINAGGQVRMLEALPLFGDGLITRDDLGWLMIAEDARAMGLYASDLEVERAFEAARITAEELAGLAQRRRTTVAAIREAARAWLVSEQYRQLVTGTAYRDPRGASPSLAIGRLQRFGEYLQRATQGIPPEFQQLMMQRLLPEAAAFASGTRRLSGPMLRHFIRDNYARLDGRVALLRPDVDAAREPSEEKLAELFETYKDVLPGEGEPFPFGYLYPDRVRLTHLEIPMDAVRARVTVEYLDVLDAYRANPQRFADAEGNAPPPEMPSPEAVRALTDELTDREAERLMGRVVATARGVLAESLRGLDERGGYYEIGDGYEPLPWEAVAAAVREAHGVEVNLAGDAENWVAVDELSSLPGIGTSRLGDGGVSLTQYVAATRQLAENPDTVMRSVRSQVGVASRPLRGFEGERYFFRLDAAEPAHAPASLDEVREQVVADAKAKAGYEQLVAQADAWRTRVIEEGLDAAAEAGGATAGPTMPFQKVDPQTAGEPPAVLNVGPSRAFVDAAFAVVEAMDEPAGDLEDRPIGSRLAVVPVPDAEGGPALALFVADRFDPLTRSGYEQVLAGGASVNADLALADVGTPNPLSLEALARRTGFDLEAYEN
ncbi:MAG: hypothetical protein AAF710_02020 [Planctomycetota bacterium]